MKEVSSSENNPVHKRYRTECFDDYFLCRKEKGCKLGHVINWLNLFTNMHNKMIINNDC